MGIAISNTTNSANIEYGVSLQIGEPDWTMIPSATSLCGRVDMRSVFLWRKRLRG